MKRLVNVTTRANFHVPIESTFAAVHSQAPKKCPRSAIIDRRLNRTGDVWHFDKAELADKICLFALHDRVGRADWLCEIVVVAEGIVMRSNDIDVWVIERFHGHAAKRFAVDHQMLRVELFDVGGDFTRPSWSRQNLVARFPSEDCGFIAILDARVDVFPRQQITDGSFKILNDLRIAPEVFGRFTPESRVFADAAPPLGLIDEGNDDANPFASGNLDDLVERAEAFFVKLARPADVDALAHVGAIAMHAEHIGPHNLPAHLADRFQRIFNFIIVRPSPRIRSSELVGILDDHQVRDVERDEAELTVAVEKLVAAASEKVFQVSICGSSRYAEQDVDRQQRAYANNNK